MPLILNGTTGISGTDGSASIPAVQGTDANTGMFFPAADQIAFAEGGTEVMRINASGNVGIGTSSPGYRLDVRDAANTTAHVMGNTSGVRVGASVDTPVAGAGYVGTYSNHPLTLGTNNAERARITSDGNVGIGTSSPAARMDVRGVIYSSNTASAYLALNHDGANGAITNNTGGMLFYANGANPIVWHTNGAERGRFHGVGQFSINTTSILGRMTMRWDNAGEQGFGLIPTGGTFNGSPIVFYNNSFGVSGFIGQGETFVSYNTGSDYRLKHDVVPLTNGLATIGALKPSTYRWNVNNSYGEGFIAHELAEHIPLAVTGEKDAVSQDGSIKPQAVDYSKIVVHLVAAVQELTAKLEAAEARIAALEAR